MKKIAIHGRNFSENVLPFVQGMFNDLAERNCEVIISETYQNFLSTTNIKHNVTQFYDTKKGIFEADFVLSLGGDGTLLESVTHVREREFPILGINTGRLGFLAAISPDRIKESLFELFNNEFEIERRSLVGIETTQNGEIIEFFDGVNFGLNELGLMKTDTSSMIVIKSYLNGQELNAYWADGLIISTPTGSTGYCLSVGGPLVMPTSDIFVIAPMSPHNLNVRPLVVSSDVVMSFEIESRSKNFMISLDSRSKVVDSDTKITMKRESFDACVIKMKDTNFLNTLRSKLNWGLDVRN
jgi:NAD+ kinase